MDPLTREYLSQVYEKQLTTFGDRPESVYWSSSGQASRFEAIVSNLPIESGMSLLDFGCGKGDLYGYLLEREIKARYTGIDITPGLIRLAKLKYPHCSFMLRDIEDTPINETFDMVIACGVFNARVSGVEESMKNSIKALCKATRHCLAFNALSARTAHKDYSLNYVDPSELAMFVREEITERFEIREDLVEGDLVLFIRP